MSALPTDAEIEAAVRDRLIERGGEYSEDEVAAICARVKALQGSENDPGAVAKLAEGLKDEKVATEFEQMNFSIGLQGGLALVEALLANCGLEAGRQEELLGKLTIPGGVPRNVTGSFKIDIPARGNRSGRSLYLHTGRCAADHDLQAELDKLVGLTEAELERVKNQCAFFIKFVKDAYGFLAAANPKLVNEAAGSLGEAKVGWGVDEANTTVFLEWGGVRREPRAGLFVSETPLDEDPPRE